MLVGNVTRSVSLLEAPPLRVSAGGLGADSESDWLGDGIDGNGLLKTVRFLGSVVNHGSESRDKIVASEACQKFAPALYVQSRIDLFDVAVHGGIAQPQLDRDLFFAAAVDQSIECSAQVIRQIGDRR